MRDKNRLPMQEEESSNTVRLGERALIDDGVTLGYPTARCSDHLLTIGPEARIRSGTVIYSGSCIGKNLETGHNVVIREQNIIGNNFRIWGSSTIDYGCCIGNNVRIHNLVYVSQFTLIEDDVFIGPGATLANDIHPGCPDAVECMEGPRIKKGAQIGANVCVLPRVVIGEHAVIGAGSVVTKDIPPAVVAFGNPAQIACSIQDLVCTTGLRDKPYGHITLITDGVKDAYTIS
jgi:acetyltransferase-like isoleucine patch superfamily enzyme